MTNTSFHIGFIVKRMVTGRRSGKQLLEDFAPGIFPPLAEEVFLALQIIKPLAQDSTAANETHNPIVFARRQIVRAIKKGLDIKIGNKVLN
ncbi:MAG TPA: hypothetical protein VL625_04170 [Patescibacteria group bacterium]|nr:hypothetical protein [Patescibacteria group bacterium]